MKRKYAEAMNVPRKKRKLVCVICLSEMPSQSLHEHYSKYHNELLVPTTSKFNNVIQKCSETSNNMDDNTKQTELLYGDNETLRLKLNVIKKNKLKQKQIKFNVPIFELHSNSNSNSNNAITNHSEDDHYKKKKKKRKHKKRKKRKKDKDNGKVKEDELTDIANHSIPYNATGYESILNSLKKFEDNSHSLSYLLLEPTMFPSDISQCKLLIKILFEQLWNARKICDEQILFIKYLNMMDTGNRMQIQFILNQLRQRHQDVYNELYAKLQSNVAWQNWKNLARLKANDDKINELKQNIEKIKQKQVQLNDEMYGDVNEMQRAAIYNLKNEQSARIQKYHLSLKNSNNNTFDLSKALKSVDSINAPTHKAPKPDIVDLINNNDDDEEW
eukprot:521801_1